MTSIVEVSCPTALLDQRREFTVSRSPIFWMLLFPLFNSSCYRSRCHPPQHLLLYVLQLFPKSRKLAYDSRQQLSQVQNAIICPSELFLSLDELSRQLDLMENLAHKETPAQREMWKRKILELREDAQSIRRQGEHYDRMVSSGIRQRRDRDDLFARRRKNRTTGGADADEMQQLTQEADSLANSHGMMNELLASGQENLSGLVGQRQRMRWVSFH